MLVIFRMLFNISVSASILAAAVIVFRLLFKKAPKWIICLLWGLVGLRLVFPFSVESIIGLLPRSNVITDSGTVNTGISAVDEGITRAAYSIATVAAPATHSAKTGMGTTAVIGEILFYVWLAGFIAMAVASAVSFIKIRLKVNQSIKLRDNIYICDEIDTPFILGIFRPEIFIPSGLDEMKIQSIIAHENSHIRRKDNWWKPLGFLLLSVYWFNPVMWIAYILLCRDIEFACDEKVLKDLTAEEVADYSQTLLDCSKPGRLVTVCPLSFGEVGVKQRIKSALSYKKPAFWIIIAALIISAVLAVAFTTKQSHSVSDGLKVVTFEQGIYNYYSVKNGNLKYEKSVNFAGDFESIHSVVIREFGADKTVIPWNETVLLAESQVYSGEGDIYEKIYNALPDKDLTQAVAYSNGNTYYVSCFKNSKTDIESTVSGKLYRYNSEDEMIEPVADFPNGFTVGVFTVTPHKISADAVQYNVSEIVWQRGSTESGTVNSDDYPEYYISSNAVYKYDPKELEQWQILGSYERINLYPQVFDKNFEYDDADEFTVKTVNSIKQNNREAYVLSGSNECCFLYQNDGSVLFAKVIHDGENKINEVLKLVPTQITYNPSDAAWQRSVNYVVSGNLTEVREKIMTAYSSIIFGIDENDKRTKIYALVKASDFEYQKIDFENLYFTETNTFVRPAVVTFNKKTGDYRLRWSKEINKEESSFKTNYNKLVNHFLFPKKYRNGMFTVSGQNLEKLWKQCEDYAKIYLSNHNINATVTRASDLPYVFYNDLISDEALKKITENLGDYSSKYPGFIGSREIILYDQVALFETRFDYETKHISFYAGTRQDNLVKKYEFDSKGWPIYINPSSSFGDGEDLTHAVSTTAPYIPDEPEKSTSLTRPAETNRQENITRVGGIDIFWAKVLEVNDSNVLAEPLEGSYERNFADRIYVSKHIIDGGSEKKTFPDVSVGDIIEVSYANMDVQKNPAVIDTVYNVKKADSLSQKVPESKESGLPKMTNKDVERLKKKDNITWDDFKGYDGRDIGSGMYVIVYDLADGGSVRVSGPSLDEEPLSISYTHPDGTTEVLKQSTRTTESSTSNGLAYPVFINNNNKPYIIMSAPQRDQYGIKRKSARKTDLGEYVGEVTKSGDSNLIGKSVYHYKAYPDSKDILILDTGNGYDFYCAQ